MGVQQDLFQKLGDSLVAKFRANIEPMKASGRTANSIHAVATDTAVEVLALRSIGTTEYGRKPTRSTTEGNPTLFDAIRDWMAYKSVFAKLDEKEAKSVAYAITKKIHEKGWETKINKPLSSVTDSINYDQLLRDVIVHQVSIYESSIIHELKGLE